MDFFNERLVGLYFFSYKMCKTYNKTKFTEQLITFDNLSWRIFCYLSMQNKNPKIKESIITFVENYDNFRIMLETIIEGTFQHTMTELLLNLCLVQLREQLWISIKDLLVNAQEGSGIIITQGL